MPHDHFQALRLVHLFTCETNSVLLCALHLSTSPRHEHRPADEANDGGPFRADYQCLLRSWGRINFGRKVTRKIPSNGGAVDGVISCCRTLKCMSESASDISASNHYSRHHMHNMVPPRLCYTLLEASSLLSPLGLIGYENVAPPPTDRRISNTAAILPRPSG